ncbi:MAG: Na+/H+ antiporter NhaA [Bacteroidales bacterium]
MKQEKNILSFVREPLERFIHLETSSSILLILFTAISMILANSPWSGTLYDLLYSPLTVGAGAFVLSKPVILWINDGLMAVFFFVIGLEIKREFLVGELSDLRRASLPVIAALGGMLVPVILFLSLNRGSAGSEGWAIPMATDIAFSLGILSLLGKRVPYALKVFLATFAIVDDLGAVLVIAFFYSSNIQLLLVLIALLIVGLLLLLTRFNLYSRHLYFIAGVIVWVLLLKSGVHATIAGVLMAFTIPIRRPIDTSNFISEVQTAIEAIRSSDKPGPFFNKTQTGALDAIDELVEKIQAPAQYLENKLHAWVSFVIMPLFALANAGIAFTGIQAGYFDLSLTIALSLVFGKLTGISLFTYLAVKLNISRLPDSVTFRQITGLALLGGFGFTMAMFIGSLAYTDAALVEASKLGIIMGSLVAGVGGYLLLKQTLPKKDRLEEQSEYSD